NVFWIDAKLELVVDGLLLGVSVNGPVIDAVPPPTTVATPPGLGIMPARATLPQAQARTAARTAAANTFRKHAGLRLVSKPLRLPDNRREANGAGSRFRPSACSMNGLTTAASRSQMECPDRITSLYVICSC